MRIGGWALACLLAACSGGGPPPAKGARGASGESPHPGAAPAVTAPRQTASPDRGVLLAPDVTRPTRRNGAYAWHPIAVSESHAWRAAAPGGELRFVDAHGVPVRITHERRVEHPDGNWTWIGRGEGHRGRRAILTFGEHAVFGALPDSTGAMMRVTMAEGRAWLVSTDASVLGRVDHPLARPSRPDYLLPPRPTDVAAGAAQAWEANQVQAAGATTFVDLVLGYTSGFKDRWLSSCSTDPARCEEVRQAMARTSLVNRVDIANQAFRDSQVPVTLRLLRTIQVDYPDATDNESALLDLTGSSGSVAPALLPLHQARERYGADLVSLVRRFQAPQNAGCGVAWLLGGGGRAIGPDDAAYAFSVVSDGSDTDEDTGVSYFCRDTTLAHEVGHNLGSTHDRETSTYLDETAGGQCGNTTTPCLHYGRYPYSFGYKAGTGGGNFHTIMAYGDQGQTEYAVFSNPRLAACAGLPCGIAYQADNARSLAQTAPVVAAFRRQVVPLHARHDINGDGRSDLLWLDPANRTLTTWLMDGPRPDDAFFFAAVGEGMELAAVGHFHGAGGADLAWRNGGQLQLWENNGAYWLEGYPDPLVVGPYPGGWSLVASGDVDADGRADLLWRDAAGARFSYWIMDGTTVVRSWVASVGPAWRVATHGDFNADGRLDLVWTDDATLVLWTGNGRSFVASTIRSHPAGWELLGAADLDADGRSDLLWRDAARTRLACWFMDGGSLVRSRGFAIGPGWSLAGYGDFNGDVRADLAWRNGGTTVLWTGTEGGFTANVLPETPPAWQAVR